jgi:VanZ family protein
VQEITAPNSIFRNRTAITFGLLIVGWIIALLVESSHPPLALLGAVEGLDKAAHFLAFIVLGLFICGASFSLNPKPAIPFFSMPLLLATLSGIAEEGYQLFVPGRAASLLDLLADIGGAGCAVLLANRFAALIRFSNQVSSK